MLKEEIWIEKYRPKKLEDVVGQTDVIKRLESYVKSRNLPHLLFSGPPGTGKCCKGNTMILTDRGIIKIEDIVHRQTDFGNKYIDHGQTNLYDNLYDDDIDKTLKEERKEEDDNIKNVNNIISISQKLNYEKYGIVERYDMGESDVVTIKTRIGLEISGTPEHKIVIIDNNGRLRFKKLQDISTTDHIAISYNTNIFNERLRLNFLYRKKRQDNTSQLLANIKYMDQSIAELLGYIIAEGNDHNDYVKITNYDKEIIDRILKICKDINIEAKENYENEKMVGVKIGSIALNEFIYYLGYRKLAKNKEVPWSILQADKDSQISFIRALFDGDGTVGDYNDHQSVEYNSSSYELCRQLQIMLLNLGIIGRLSSKKGVKLEYRGEIREFEESYRLVIMGGELLKFAEIINFGLSRKKEILDRCVEILENKYRWTDITYPHIEKIINILYEELKMLGQKGKIIKRWQEDFEIGNKTIKLNRQKAISCKEYLKEEQKGIYRFTSGGRKPTRYKLGHILSIMSPVNYLPEYRYLETLGEKFIFDNVVLIKNGRTKVYDVTIDNVHSYIGNSIINHNTASAICVARELFGENWMGSFTELNASVSKDTPVLVRINGTVERTTFGKLDGMFFGENCDVKNVENIEVLSVDNNMKVLWKKVSKIIRHKANKILRISFEGGKIELTGNHSVIEFDKDGNFTCKSAGDLREGEHLISFVTADQMTLDVFYGDIGGSYNDIVEKIDMIIDGDLHSTKIKKIEVIDYDDYVYDFSVPGSEMFFAGNIPILLHNSDERGIDVVRIKIKNFARTAPLGESEFKIIFLDEADALTIDAQSALRRTMEKYTSSCRFILSCNYSSKIIEPIQSRCAVYRFRPMSGAAVEERILYIAKTEGITLTKDGLEAILYVAAGDMRRAINALQAAAMLDKTVNMDAIYKTTSTAKPSEIIELIRSALDGNFGGARSKLDYLLIDQGFSGEDIIGQIYRTMFDMTISDRLKVDLIDKIGEIDFRIAEGANERIQIEALIAHFILCGANEKLTDVKVVK